MFDFGSCQLEISRETAFPAISCGVYGYPLPDAARVAIGEVLRFLQEHPPLERIIFCCFDPEVARAYTSLLPQRLADEQHRSHARTSTGT